MRSSLENIALIDQYLSGKLSQNERAAFETELNENTELKQLFENHQLLVQAAKRAALKAEIAQISSGNGWGGLAKTITVLVILASTLALMLSFLNSKTDVESAGENPVQKTVIERIVDEYIQPNDSIDSQAELIAENPGTKTVSKKSQDSDKLTFNGLKVWEKPNIQITRIDAENGGVVEGEEGTLIVIPNAAFQDENGQTISGKVDVELVEALTLDKMVLYNLTTMADDKMLQTGGMIHLDYKQNGERVFVKEDRPVLVQIPTDEVKAEMQLFEGKVTKEGNINWENPKPLEKFLVKVDLVQLEFKPEGMAEAIRGLSSDSKYFAEPMEQVDSIYYTLTFDNSSTIFSEDSISMSEEEDLRTILENKYPKVFRSFSNNKEIESNIQKSVNSSEVSENENICGIKPTSIQAIKTKKFADSFIATREFERRLAALHKLDNGDAMLQIYIKNLKKNLSEVDALVAEKLKGEEAIVFQNFAKENATNVKDLNLYGDKLYSYYRTEMTKNQRAADKRRTEDSKKTQEQLSSALKKVREARESALADLNGWNQPIINRPSVRNPQITTASLTNVLQPATNPNSVVNRQAYSFSWAGFGWANIDEYLHLLEKGSKKVLVNAKSKMPEFTVYQWLNNIKTLTPLNKRNAGEYQSDFPIKGAEGSDAMQSTYALAIGRDGDKFTWAMTKFNPYENEMVELNESEAALAEIKETLRSLSSANKPLIDQLKSREEGLKNLMARQKENKEKIEKYNRQLAEIDKKFELESWKILEQNRLKESSDRGDLNKLLGLIGECYILAEPEIERKFSNAIESVDIRARFPGGSKELQKTIQKNLIYPQDALAASIEASVIVKCLIEEDGNLIPVVPMSNLPSVFVDEAFRVLKTLPAWIPAVKNGVPIPTHEYVTVNFSLD